MLYDTLVRDLKRALDAIDSKNIETRAAEVKHALLVLDQLEAWLDFNNGGEAATSLSRFYAVARSRIVEGHAKVDPALFQEQIRLFLEVRSAWEQAEAARKASESSVAPKMQSSSSLSCSA
jgi:flagellar biosynthetic protein FliS